MTALIIEIIGPFWPYIAAAVGALVLFLTGRRKGAQAAKADRAETDAKADKQAIERIVNADLGADATDDERVERLREFAAQHGNRPSQAKGGKLRGGPR